MVLLLFNGHFHYWKVFNNAIIYGDSHAKHAVNSMKSAYGITRFIQTLGANLNSPLWA